MEKSCLVMELMSVGFEEECVAATEAAEAASRSAVPSTPSPGELSWAVSPVLSPGVRSVAKPELEPEPKPKPWDIVVDLRRLEIPPA